MVLPATCASPTPIRIAERWASGARSPEAPTEPFAGMQGSTSWVSSAISASITDQRTPEWPRASEAALRARIRRTTGRGSSGPVPTACDRIRLRCNSRSRAGSIRVLASRPKPVLMP